MFKKLFLVMVIASLALVPVTLFAMTYDEYIASVTGGNGGTPNASTQTTQTTTLNNNNLGGDGSSTQVIHITYTRDEFGKLIGQHQTITTTGTDIDGVPFTSVTEVDYQIFQGEGKILKSVTTSVTEKEDGSKETSVTTTDYAGCYDEGGRLVKAPTGTRTVTGNTAEYTDDNGVTHAAEQYEGSYTMEYKIIAGSAYVEKMTGSTTYNTIDEQTQTYVENRTTVSSVTYEYEQINGDVLTKSTTASSLTTMVQADDEGNHLWSSSTITTTYQYNQTTGALVSAEGHGTGAGYLLNNGYQTYTSDITVTYEVKNGVAVQTDYLETRNWDSPEAPSDITPPAMDDPAVQGTVKSATVVQSAANNAGQRNYYVYVLVDATAFDEVKGDGEWQELDGDQYLVRISCGQDKAAADKLAAEYMSKQGTVMSFFGNVGGNRIIDFLGIGAGGFDLPKL